MLLLNRYSYNPQTDLVADGGNSKAYKARDTQQADLVVIVKFYYAVTTDLFTASMERIKGLKHPQLVQLYDYTEVESVNAFGQTDVLRIGIWEYVQAAKSDISSESTAVTEKVVRDTLNALQYLYQNKCAHLDLCRNNILITQENEIKLNNYEIARQQDDDSAVDQQKDIRAFGQTLYELLGGTSAPHLSANTNDELNAKLPESMREVYGVMIQKCNALAETSNVSSFDDLTNLLDNYDRNKRFEAVVALNEDQFVSRYAFDPDTSKIAQSNHSLTYQAHDNLLNREVSLEIFMLDEATNGASLLATLKPELYAHLFKVLLSADDNNHQAALVGLLAPQPVEQAVIETSDVSASEIGATGIVALAGDTATYGSAIIDKRTDSPAAAESSTHELVDDDDTNIQFGTDPEEIITNAIEDNKIIIDEEENPEGDLNADSLHVTYAKDIDGIVNDAVDMNNPLTRDSTGIPLEMVDMDLARELAALDAKVNSEVIAPLSESTSQEAAEQTVPQTPEAATEEAEEEAPEAAIEVIVEIPEVAAEDHSDDDSTAVANDEPTADAPALPTDDASDEDLVDIKTPEMLDDEEAIKGTEVIANEAIEQVMRDYLQRLAADEAANEPANVDSPSSLLADTPADNDDFVSIHTPDAQEDEEAKGTEVIEHEAIEQVMRDFLKGNQLKETANEPSNNDTPSNTAATDEQPANNDNSDDDDDDYVSLDTPDMPDDDAIKGTEIIAHEAIEQVLRDMERLLKK